MRSIWSAWVDEERSAETHLLANAADGAGGGVFPDEDLGKPALSEADSDIISIVQRQKIRY